MADVPLFALVVTKELGAGHEEHPPTLPPELRVVGAIALAQYGQDALLVAIHSRQPGFAGLVVVQAIQVSSLLDAEVVTET